MEETRKFLQGQDYKIYIEHFVINTSGSSFTVKLGIFRTFILFYILILLAWSPIFFQFSKIIQYLRSKD